MAAKAPLKVPLCANTNLCGAQGGVFAEAYTSRLRPTGQWSEP